MSHTCGILATFDTMWGPRSIAKLVNITPITMVYGTYNYSYWGESKPTYNWGATLQGMMMIPLTCLIHQSIPFRQVLPGFAI